MSKFTVQGTITKIGEKKELTGAVALDYELDVTEDNGYVKTYFVGMYKKDEYKEHIDNFMKFNKVGDNVELQFTLGSRRATNGNGGWNNVNHWQCNKVEVPTENAEELDPLPF